MRLYAVALVIWTAIVTTSSESNVADFSDEKAVEFRDSLVKQIAQPYVTRSIKKRSIEQIGIEDRSSDSPTELSRSVTCAESTSGSNGVSTIDPASSGESVYAQTPLTETTDRYSFRERPGDGYAIPEEDVLLVESAFGQRVPPDERIIAGRFKTNNDRPSGDYMSFRKTIIAVSPFKEENNQKKIHVPSTRKPSVLALRKKSDSSDNSKDPKKITGPKNLGGNPHLRNSTEGSSNGTSVLENDIVFEYLPDPQIRSSRAHNEDTSKQVEVMPTEKSGNAVTSISVEISPSLQLTKFSGPIVVADLPARKAQDSTVDYTDGSSPSEAFIQLEDIGAPEINTRSSKTAASNSITVSSLMLKPLQVGITLVNEADELSAATETKDYFREDLQQRLVGLVENNGNHSTVRYKDENVQHNEGERAIEVVTQKPPDNSVEIQKSVELYHTAPVHEIHYPVEYIQQTAHLGVIETNSIGNAQRLRQPYDQDGRLESRLNYDAYQGNNEKPVIKGHAASAYNRQEYNVLEDDVGKPEYSASNQPPVDSSLKTPLRYEEARPELLLVNQFDKTLYEQSSNARHILNNMDNNATLRYKLAENPTRHEVTDEFVKPYATTAVSYQEPPSVISHPVQSEARRPQEQLLLKIIPNGASVDAGFLVPIPRPIEKVVRVPVQMEKVIEKKVQIPYPVPVDRLVEKQIRVPHLYPIHSVIEKRVPYMVQRLQPPSPLHFRSPMIYSIERPVHAAIERPSLEQLAQGIEKSVEKPVVVSSRPPRTDGSVETKHKYQQRPQIFADEDLSYDIESNASQFYGDPYAKLPSGSYGQLDDGGDKYHVPAATHLPNNMRLMIVPKKFAAQHTVLLRSSPSYAMLPVSFRRQIVYNLVEKDNVIKNIGSLSPRKALVSQVKPLFPVVKPSLFSTSVTQSPTTTTIGGLRRTRQPGQYAGSFRQSKMEYGFKPPMVPSVQYDEKTASKVEK
ncbi:PREDICTED: uncharacterized protein LOC106751655 [Dinoponera quadriceps]|uniref:Uncharacterized protein LOC106751655 n=1 Tax=Dinoponera quadriceps TaxID=609295 RepID=A0A6P3YAS5_DINQU|nr:PREDICTED: uncharacterized protein LOC106751655 [Dinoponera quadriceps]